MKTRVWFGVGMALALVLRASNGTACSLAPSAFSVGEVTPVDTGEAEINAPIVVAFTAEGFVNTFGDAPYLTPTLSLWELASGSPVALGDAQRVMGTLVGPAAYSFVPSSALQPGTTYQVSVNTGQDADVQAQLMGPATHSWQFTTTSASRPPMSVDGVLSVTFEAGTVPHLDCGAPSAGCGSGCTENGTEPATIARLQLPPVSGGFTDTAAFVNATVAVTHEKPLDESAVNTPGVALAYARVENFAPDRPSELTVAMPMPAGQVYSPCFTFTVVDARGDELRAEPLCLSEPFPAPDGTDSGCSIGGRPSSPPGSVAAIVALAWLAFRRRRSE